MEQNPVSTIIISNRIRDMRKIHELTQEALARALGVSRQSIISVETGKCLPSIPLAYALARFFRSPLEQIFTIDNQSNANRRYKKENNMSEQGLSPTRGITSIHDSIDRMFEEAFMPMRRSFEGILAPQMNIYQTDKDIVVEADVPGMTEEDVEIEINDGILTIKGERQEKEEKITKDYFHREVSYGSFQRSLPLPTDVVAETATATVKNGQLKVVLPKVEPAMSKVHKVKPTKE